LKQEIQIKIHNKNYIIKKSIKQEKKGRARFNLYKREEKKKERTPFYNACIEKFERGLKILNRQ
jgi:hypothetical protein